MEERKPDGLEGQIRMSEDFDRENAEQAGSLPRRCRDPFDRFLIAQARAEGLVLVTRDTRIPLYGVRTMAAQDRPAGNTYPCPRTGLLFAREPIAFPEPAEPYARSVARPDLFQSLPYPLECFRRQSFALFQQFLVFWGQFSTEFLRFP